MWHGIEGHDDVVERFRRALMRGRLASSFLFAGPPGVGKRTFAMKLAQALLCQARPEQAMDPCEACPSCSQVIALTHPDLDVVAKPEGKSSIPLDLLVGDIEHRRREGLCHNIALKPYLGRRKVAVIDDADDLNEEGANALLKTLEEPPPCSVLILIGTTPAKQLPTIRSRCQLIRFRPLGAQSVASLLVAKGYLSDIADARRLAEAGEGSVSRAVAMADPDLWTFRHAPVRRTSAGHCSKSFRWCRRLPPSWTPPARSAPARRARLRQAIAFAAEYYRQVLHAQCGKPHSDDRAWASRGERTASLPGAAPFAQPADFQPAAADAEPTARGRAVPGRRRPSRSEREQATLVECWLDDLAAGRGAWA